MPSMCVHTTLNLVFVCKAGTVPATVNTTDTPYILIESWADCSKHNPIRTDWINGLTIFDYCEIGKQKINICSIPKSAMKLSK